MPQLGCPGTCKPSDSASAASCEWNLCHPGWPAPLISSLVVWVRQRLGPTHGWQAARASCTNPDAVPACFSSRFTGPGQLFIFRTKCFMAGPEGNPLTRISSNYSYSFRIPILYPTEWSCANFWFPGSPFNGLLSHNGHGVVIAHCAWPFFSMTPGLWPPP